MSKELIPLTFDNYFKEKYGDILDEYNMYLSKILNRGEFNFFLKYDEEKDIVYTAKLNREHNLYIISWHTRKNGLDLSDSTVYLREEVDNFVKNGDWIILCQYI